MILNSGQSINTALVFNIFPCVILCSNWISFRRELIFLNTLIQLKILIEALDKKMKLLEEILNITENENTVLKYSYDASMMSEMLDHKQTRIEEVNTLDNTFEDIYSKIKYALDENPKEYSLQIRTMQDKIRSVTDFYVRIKVLEEKNKLLFSTTNINKKNQINIPKKNALGSYAKHTPHKK